MSSPGVFDALKALSRKLGDRPELYRFLEDFYASHPTCRFLQIGSNDGLRHDPLREFIVRGGWRGVLVEPVPHVYERLKRNYARHADRLHFLNAAVSNTSGSLPFYMVAPQDVASFHEAADMVSSFDRAHVEENVPGAAIVETIVPAMTIDDILSRFGFLSVDLIHLDVEGHEADILMSLDYERVRPEAIIFEAIHLGGTAECVGDVLRAASYTITRYGMDSVAVRT